VSPDPDLSLALALSDAAGAISIERCRAHNLVVETKPDLTPVTEADRQIERTIRDLLSAERPDDGVLGEETRQRLVKIVDGRAPSLVAADLVPGFVCQPLHVVRQVAGEIDDGRAEPFRRPHA